MPERGMRGVSARHIVFDVETTGLFPEKGHRIIEIAAVALVANSPDEEFHSLINVGKPVPRAAQADTGDEE
jgi:DNA polymerase III subunit epsilon